MCRNKHTRTQRNHRDRRVFNVDANEHNRSSSEMSIHLRSECLEILLSMSSQIRRSTQVDDHITQRTETV